MNKVTVLVTIIFLSAAYYVAARFLESKQPTTDGQANIKIDVERQLTSGPVDRLREQPNPAPKRAVLAWSSVSDSEKIPTISSYPRDIPSAVLLKITQLRANRWEEGDHIEFYVPQIDYTVTSTIEEKKEHAGGIVTLKSYPDETLLNNVLVTLGQKNTFVNLFTPSGEYELVGNLEHGWLIPSANLGSINSILDVKSSNAAPVYTEEPTPKKLEPTI